MREMTSTRSDIVHKLQHFPIVSRRDIFFLEPGSESNLSHYVFVYMFFLFLFGPFLQRTLQILSSVLTFVPLFFPPEASGSQSSLQKSLENNSRVMKK